MMSKQKRLRVEKARIDYQKARDIAEDFNWILKRFTPWFYQLRRKKSRLIFNLYPTTQKVCYANPIEDFVQPTPHAQRTLIEFGFFMAVKEIVTIKRSKNR